MDKANLSTPSVLAQLPVFGTPPRRDRPRGGPAPAPGLGCRALRPGRPCDRPGAVSSPTLDPHHPPFERPGWAVVAWPGPDGRHPIPWPGWGGCHRVLARALAGAWLAPLRCASSCLLSCPPGGEIVQPGCIAIG